MKRRMRRRNPGQSIVLLALIIAVLIGLVALSVDVGNAYAQQRASQRATDAAVTDAMRVAVLKNATNNDVRQAIMDSLTEHNIVFDKNLINVDGAVPVGSRGIKLTYFLDDQREIPVNANDDPRPTNMRYIKLDLLGSESTNFASLFGQSNLGVHAQSYARHTICSPFPIGIDDAAFNATGDSQVQFQYTDENLRKKTGRRLYMRDNLPQMVGGKFAWLRWLPTNGTAAQQAALADVLSSTNTSPEYKEADWPTSAGPKPDSYPNLPGIITESDWVLGAVPMKLPRAFSQVNAMAPLYQYVGADAASADQVRIADRLEWHIKNRSIINLPVYVKKTSDFGEDARYQIDRFEGFLITGFGYDLHATGDTALGAGWYLDVVRMGDVQECVELIGGGNVTQPLTLRGSVQINPVYQNGATSLRTPIDIVVVLDASGSMNWTWDGQGTLSQDMYDQLRNPDTNPVDSEGQTFLRAKYQPNGVGVDKPFLCGAPDVLALDKPCQSADAWGDYKERRLYKAKTAIASFLNGFPWQANDRAAVVTYSGFTYVKGKGTAGASTAGLAKGYPSGSDGKGELSKNIIGPGGVTDLLLNQAAATNPVPGDPSSLYKTLGASPGYHGLARAHELLQKAPLDSPTGERKRVVIFLTDGLLNVDSTGGKSAQETITANIGDPTKPINQAITESESIRGDQSFPAEVYVIAMGVGYEQAGLATMATQPGSPYFQSSQDEDAMQKMLDKIAVKVKTDTCERREVGWVVPDPANAVNEQGAPLASPKVGFVRVWDNADNFIADYDINIDATTGEAVFKVPNLQPSNSYKFGFWIYYKGLDNETRLYSTIITSGDPQQTLSHQMQRAGVSLVETLPLQKLKFSGTEICPTGSNATPTP